MSDVPAGPDRDDEIVEAEVVDLDVASSGRRGAEGDLGGAMPDLGALLEQAQQMAAGMADAQQAAAETVVEGSAGGGVVKVEVSGTFDFHRVHIDPSIYDSGDVAMLEDLLVAALRDAARRVLELQEQSLGGLGDLGGLLG